MEKPKEPKQSSFKSFLLLLFLMIGGLILYARYVSTSGLITNEYGIVYKNLPQPFHGLKIVQFSDLHYGRTVDKQYLKSIVNKINELKPDIVIFTGDLIDKDVIVNNHVVKSITSILKDIDAKIGKYTIKGNHDYVDQNFELIMNDADFIILNNSYDLVYHDLSSKLFIGGIPSTIKDYADYEKTFTYLKEHPDEKLFKILLMHEPDNIDNTLDYQVDLVLAGHSHNGQIRIPYYGAVIKPKGSRKYFEPYYKVKDSDLYISSGIGTSQISFRFCNRPSINLFRLYSK